MGDSEMLKPKLTAACAFSLIVALLIASVPAPLSAASVRKTVTAMEDGRYMIKLRVTASDASIYALKLGDPKAAIVDVYAPKGWCIVTDGEDFLARTSGSPIQSGKTIEFILHSTSADVSYSWTAFGKVKQLGKPGTV
jgi:hypothetical protein